MTGAGDGNRSHVSSSGCSWCITSEQNTNSLAHCGSGAVLSASTHAVFISYASEDSEAAARIAEALGLAGIEVWFDKSELRGGDAWDRRIREQIQHCQLLLAIISANTESRDEGYFRREWKLAVDRTRDMADDRAFIIPVVIDGTSERRAAVPDWFRQVQWIRLPRGEPTSDFSARIAALLGAGSDAALSHELAERGPSEARSARARTHSFQRWLALTALILATAIAAGWILWSYRALHSSGDTSAGGTGKALAVLPFVDLSQAHDQEYLADGMAEEILDVLTKIPHLTVIGRTSSFQFKGRNEDLRTVGRKLGAAYIVEGSVRKSGSRVRVSAQLIDAQSASHVWSESYDRDFRDVLLLQDQVASNIARALQLLVNSSDLVHESIRNPEAYTLYLQGRVAFDRGDVSALRESQADFEQALALDPTLTRAAEGLLLAYLNLVYNQGVPATTGWPRVRTLAEDVLRRDPGSVFAHSALAWVHAYYDYNLAACNHELDAILTAQVRDPIALVYSAWIASVVHRKDMAERLIRQAIVADPLSPDAYQAMGGILRDAGDLGGAERAFRQSLLISPTFALSHIYIAEVFYYRNQLADALTEANAEAPSSGRQALTAGLQFLLGRKQDSEASLLELTRNVGDGDAYWIAIVYTMRGDKEHAFEWLDKAYAHHDLSLHIGVDPIFAPLRADPRWTTLMARMSD